MPPTDSWKRCRSQSDSEQTTINLFLNLSEEAQKFEQSVAISAPSLTKARFFKLKASINISTLPVECTDIRLQLCFQSSIMIAFCIEFYYSTTLLYCLAVLCYKNVWQAWICQRELKRGLFQADWRLSFSIVYILSFLACQGRIKPMECIAPYKTTLLLLYLLLLLLLLLFLNS